MDKWLKKNGDNFDEIYNRYFAMVYKFLLSLCHDPPLAEELTQEAFFKVLKNLDKYDPRYKLSTWLCQIAKNTYYSYADRQRGRGEPLPDIADGYDIEQRLVDADTALAIHRVLHSLREPYKEVFSLRTFGELSFAQIGLLFDKSESWARVTYYRAKVMIKEELQ